MKTTWDELMRYAPEQEIPLPPMQDGEGARILSKTMGKIKETKRKPARPVRTVLIAAAIAALLCGSAFAAHSFGWFDRLFGEKAALVKEQPAYGRVICRCETITEGEILAALHSEVPANTIDGVKRRAGAGMGRCQGGFCGPRVLELISRELGIDPLDILQDKNGSNVLLSETKVGGKSNG